ncbi:pyruvate dehydrogenase phosphatase regulatory subunit, mitochondrial-like protein [Sarcoptes scabiei]|uniref:Pyruvate dehydrogenase phosphatase regulatory subunit, mitochondrial-like protein n=1 Tax=Sarcoptes scabiei TaxID=52283 RepID=A0A132AJF7_SARSC|nr:pyruvate dehydrogenase phosphatase regulatory subunit, mitochondrial-like protein [Sarcoptes scabiei]
MINCLNRLKQLNSVSSGSSLFSISRCFFSSRSKQPFYETASDLPSEIKVVIYGDELVSKALAHLLSDSLGSDVIVIRGHGPRTEEEKALSISTLNSFFLNHLIVSNPRSSLLIRYSANLYRTKTCGAIYLAQTEERVKSFKRMLSISKLFIPKECGTIELLSPEEIKRRYDYIDVENIKCGIHLPFDGVVMDRKAEELKLEQHAQSKGVQFFNEFILNKIHVNNDRVSNIELLHPITHEIARIKCDYFVNSANNYLSRTIGKCSLTRVRVPSLACEHQILETQPMTIPNTGDSIMPIINDFDNRFSIYQHDDKRFILTGYEKVSRVVRKLYSSKSENHPLDIEIPKLPIRMNDFYHLLNPILNRLPILRQARYKELHARLENFTPDGRPLIGEVAEINNYLIAAGVWPSLSGGTAKLLEQIILKKPNSFQHDFWSLDPKRFITLHSNRIFLFDRLREIPAKARYNINFPTPHNSYQTGHGLLRSPLYDPLKEAGAYFTQFMGYERPAVYLKDQAEPYGKNLPDCGVLEERILETPSFGKPHWFDAVKSEYFACRERVAILDYSSFTKISISSVNDEALELLQYLCSNNIDMPIGSITLTGMQNAHGGFENDVSIIRTGERNFLLIGPTESQFRCLKWLRSNVIEEDRDQLSIRNVTQDYCAICIMGPYAKMLLTDVVAAAALAMKQPMNEYLKQLEHFPFFTAKELLIGSQKLPVLVCNLSHTGELGFVLYMLNPYSVQCYETLFNAGKKYSIQNAGSICVRVLRIEKFFSFWGQDLDSTTTPLECGREFRVCYDKNFIGKEALIKQKRDGVKRRYVQLILDSFDPDKEPLWPWGGEPIYLASDDGLQVNNDRPVGMTTTTSFGFTLNRMVCLGYIANPDPNVTITNDYLLNRRFEVEIGGNRYSAHINLYSPKLTDITGTYVASASKSIVN